MKYEMIFGDQSLFDGAPEEATHAAKGGGFYKIENMSAKYVSDGIFNGIDVLSVGGNLIAERRIIAEPKLWTVEDWKDGRLPDVGCMVMVTSVDECASVAAINNDAVCVVFHDGEFITLHKSGISPIETPEEKAQRLRSEWINKAYVDFHRFGCEIEVLQKEQLKQVYDALLSGELPMPSKKGGE